MKMVLFSLLAALPIFLFSQNEKGVTPVKTPVSATNGTTRAVVVGISNYQSPEIPDLKFADCDAKFFADWLKSPAGGNVPEVNIQYLTNEKATNAAFAAALDWLVETCKEGEQAIIYFSGHGDVETKTVNQLGFLLLHDSPARCYKAGAYSLVYLQDVVSTLSIQNRVRVTVVTDACHAGKLAGSSVNGTQATAQNLSKQFANEVKIMSCQPNEFSLEGKQWGDGRGVFSWHLIDGLVGLADKNEDGQISLFEIGRYLEDKVPAETAPQSQLPMTAGDRQATLARVDATTLANLRTAKTAQKAALASVGSKGFEDVFLRETDSLTQKLYADFKAALERHELLDAPEGRRTADSLLRELLEQESIAPLHSMMRRNLAVALQDEVQQALNALLENDPYEANNWAFNPKKYGQFPAYLARTLELLGEGHYLAKSILSKKAYFEGFNLVKNIGEFENDPTVRDTFKTAAKAKFLESIRLEPEAAYPYHAIGDLYLASVPYRSDSLEWWCQRAAELSPDWLAPYLEISYEYQLAQYNIEKSAVWLEKALALHPESYLVQERHSWLKQWQGKADESIAISKEMIAAKPDIFNAYSTLATALCRIKGEHLESEQYCLKSLELEPNQLWWAEFDLEINYNKTRRATEVVKRWQKWLDNPGSIAAYDKGMLFPSFVEALVRLERYDDAERYCQLFDAQQLGIATNRAHLKAQQGRVYLAQGNLEKAEQTFQAAFDIDPASSGAWIALWALLGDLKWRQGKLAEAEAFFQKAITFRKNPFEENLFRDEAFFRYGRFLLDQNRPAEAEARFREIGQFLPKSCFYGYGMALISAKKGDKTAALDWLEKSLDNFWPDGKAVLAEPLFEKIRKGKRFKALFSKNFPDFNQ